MQKILIVGGAGYIGGAITDLLFTNDQFEVTVYDSILFQPYYLKPNINFVKGDIRDSKLLKKYLDSAEIVIWLAAHVGDGACTVHPEVSLEINRERVEWLSQNFRGKIIYTSTCSVYGLMDGLLTEDSPTNPISLYASSKLQSEQYIKDKGVCYRLGTLYGLGDNYSRIRLDLVVNKMTSDSIQYGEVSVYGGEQFRPCLHVKDVAEQIYKDILGGVTHSGIYNLSNQNLTILEIAQLVSKVVPTNIKITDIPTEDLRNYSVSCEKAKKDLGFSPSWSVLGGIREIAQILQDGRISNVNDPIYHNHNFFKLMTPYLNPEFAAIPSLKEEVATSQISSVI